MHPIAEQLLEQHIEFELDALTGAGLQPFLRSETRRCFELAEELTLNELATERRCAAAFRRLLVESKIPESAGDLGLSLFLRFAELLGDTGVDLQEVIGQERFLELVTIAAGFEEPRRRLLAEVFNHPFYSELISSLVYKALLNYLIEDNLISQRVPGVGSMLKLGRKVATRALPNLDATVERQLKGYIRSYLPSLIKASEQFVDSAVTDESFEERVAEAWADLGSRRIADLAAGLGPDDAADLRTWTEAYRDELRGSELFVDVGETLLAHVFERYGNQPVAVLLDDLGISPTLVSKELATFAPPLLKRLRKAGYLGELLRRRLAPFYESDAVRGTLERLEP